MPKYEVEALVYPAPFHDDITIQEGSAAEAAMEAEMLLMDMHNANQVQIVTVEEVH